MSLLMVIFKILDGGKNLSLLSSCNCAHIGLQALLKDYF